MRNFDEIRAEREGYEREFQIGGETFVVKPYVHPAAFLELQLANGDYEFLDLADELIPGEMLEGADAKKRWLKARDRKNPKPLSIRDVVTVVNFIQEATSGRPTVPSNGSSPTPTANGTGSTGISSSAASTSGSATPVAS